MAFDDQTMNVNPDFCQIFRIHDTREKKIISKFSWVPLSRHTGTLNRFWGWPNRRNRTCFVEYSYNFYPTRRSITRNLISWSGGSGGERSGPGGWAGPTICPWSQSWGVGLWVRVWLEDGTGSRLGKQRSLFGPPFLGNLTRRRRRRRRR